jgi:predicted ATPase
VRADLEVTDANAATIGAICRRLDGLPLALELAAARLRVLTPQDLLVRLARRLPILTGGPRDAPDRQRTLRAAIAWSYDLLSDEAQERFRRLAVFRGGATPAAVAAVWGLAETDPALIDALASLVEQSLVLWQGDGAHERVRLLETVREYAEEQLEASGAAPGPHAPRTFLHRTRRVSRARAHRRRAGRLAGAAGRGTGEPGRRRRLAAGSALWQRRRRLTAGDRAGALLVDQEPPDRRPQRPGADPCAKARLTGT